MRPGTGTPRSAAPAPPAVAAVMSGAVDLAAVRARSEAQARAAEAPPPSAAGAVVAVTEDTFQVEVLDRSFQVPVLLDLWAEWCEPCKQLSPMLERLAKAAGGAWILATIDVDANPRISQALQVQSIPTIFAVIGGQLVPGFQGALPEAQIREFITAVLEAGQQAGLTGGPPAEPEDQAAPEAAPELPPDPRFVAAEDALEAGDYEGAAGGYQRILDAEPANADAQAALLQTRLLQRLSTLPADAAERAAAAPGDVTAVLAGADLLLARNQVEDALEALHAAFRRFTAEDRETVRLRLVEYFEVLGSDDPRVPPARRKLAAALF